MSFALLRQPCLEKLCSLLLSPQKSVISSTCFVVPIVGIDRCLVLQQLNQGIRHSQMMNIRSPLSHLLDPMIHLPIHSRLLCGVLSARDVNMTHQFAFLALFPLRIEACTLVLLFALLRLIIVHRIALL